MKKPLIFVDRRNGNDRRLDLDPCSNLPVDLYHRKRRKSKDRRESCRSLSEDYYAYMEAAFRKLGLPSEGEISPS